MTNPPRAYINAGGTHPRMSRFGIWISRRGSAHRGVITVLRPQTPVHDRYAAQYRIIFAQSEPPAGGISLRDRVNVPAGRVKIGRGTRRKRGTARRDTFRRFLHRRG